MSTSQSIKPVITWVNPEASKSGKTVKVYLMHETFDPGVTHFAYVPVELAPEKWNAIEAPVVKLGDVETSYEDEAKNVVALQKPRRQVSFFGTVDTPVAIGDGPELAPTQWVDKRTKRTPVTTDDGAPF
jgi:hypothetical protein